MPSPGQRADGQRQAVPAVQQRVVAGGAGDIAVAAQLFVKEQRLAQSDHGRILRRGLADGRQIVCGDGRLQPVVDIGICRESSKLVQKV